MPKYPQPLHFETRELEDINRILHLTLHRSKNQHRLAKWFKSFQMLRRNLAKLQTELEQCTVTQTKTSRAAVEDRTAFMLEFLMPKCYRSFGTLVADNQFAALGLMLTATLARVNKLITPLQRRVEVVVPTTAGKQQLITEDIGEPVLRENRENIGKPSKLKASAKSITEDIGVPVLRENQESIGKPSKFKASEQSKPDQEKSEKKPKKVAKPSSMSRSVDDTPTKPPKKKRKKGNAIDDLFSGLL